MNAALRVAVLCCFVGHGVMALMASAVPYSEWNVWVQRLVGGDMDVAMWLLRIVGSLDVVAGLCMLLPRVPTVAFAWTIAWGLATATSRLVLLGALAGPFWVTVGHPVGEFLARAANWAMPLLLYVRLGERRLPLVAAIPERRWLLVVVLSSTLGWIFAYFTDMDAPTFPHNITLTGEPLWMFFAGGALALAALVSLWPYPRQATRAVAGWIPFAVFVLSDVVAVWFVHRPRGPLIASLQVVEHMPIYVALVWWARLRRDEPAS